MAAWKKAFQTTNPDATVNYDPVRLRRRPRAVPRRRPRRSPARTPTWTTKSSPRPRPLCKGDIVEVPVYVSPIAVIYNLDGVDELNLTRPRPSPTSSPARSRRGTTRPSRPTTPTPSCPAPRSRRCTAPTTRARRRTSPTTCRRLSEGAWTAERRTDVAGQGRRGCRGHLGRRGCRHERQGHDRLRRREPGRRPRPGQGQGGRRRSTPPRLRLPPRCSTPPRPSPVAPRRTSRSTSTAPRPRPASTRSSWRPTRSPARHPRRTRRRLIKAWLTYVASPEGQSAAADTAGSAPLTADFGKKVQAAIETIKAS